MFVQLREGVSVTPYALTATILHLRSPYIIEDPPQVRGGLPPLQFILEREKAKSSVDDEKKSPSVTAAQVGLILRDLL